EKPAYGAAYASLTVRYQDGREIRSYKAPDGKSGRLTVDLFKRGFIWTSATVIRKSVLDGFVYDESLRQSYEDGDFFLRLSTITEFLFVKEVQAIRREQAQGLSVKSGIQPTRVLVLERFYYKLGGRELVPFVTARKKISHVCRKVAKSNLDAGNRCAAMILFKKAIKYWPLDTRLYAGFVRACIDKSRDHKTDWKMPEKLNDSIETEEVVNSKKSEIELLGSIRKC
ncbi:MAG: hypothetical protein KAS23_09320, partial [Anaerohalosphaera sp.]|nr:hypothetical protein [Anaerohalosphaera sp.]